MGLSLHGACHAVSGIQQIALGLLGITSLEICHGSGPAGGPPPLGKTGAPDCCGQCPSCAAAATPDQTSGLAVFAGDAFSTTTSGLLANPLRSDLSDRPMGPRGPPQLSARDT